MNTPAMALTAHAPVLMAALLHASQTTVVMKINGTRPALANEPVHTNAAGQVALELITAWCDGVTHQVMSPLEITLPRMAAMVPQPHVHVHAIGYRCAVVCVGVARRRSGHGMSGVGRPATAV